MMFDGVTLPGVLTTFLGDAPLMLAMAWILWRVMTHTHEGGGG